MPKTLYPIQVTTEEGGYWKPVLTPLEPDALFIYLREGSGSKRIPIRTGCCIKAVAFHSILFPNGTRWDEINGITDVGC